MSSNHADTCECTDCLASPFTPDRVMDRLVKGTSDVASAQDPLDAELTAAALTWASSTVPGGLVVDTLVKGFEGTGTTESLALLMGIGAVAGGETGERARAAAARLVARGVTRPGWADEFVAPVTLGECFRFVDEDETGSILCCSFRRAQRGHVFFVAIEHSDGAAGIIQIFPDWFLAARLEEMRENEKASTVKTRIEQLEPAKLRRMIVDGLEAQALRELAGGLPVAPPTDEDGQPGYQVLSILIRARMDLLPV